MAPLGIGIDTLEIERIRDSLKKHGEHFYEKLFTPREIDYCLQHNDPAIPFSGRFTAKEAIAKALGFGFGKEISWQDIEITHAPTGQPLVQLSPALMERFDSPTVLLSISHSKTQATSVALITSG